MQFKLNVGQLTFKKQKNKNVQKTRQINTKSYKNKNNTNKQNTQQYNGKQRNRIIQLFSTA